MSKNLGSAENVSQAVLHRLATGKYHPGDRLPSVRDLAAELGSNRNTVNKAYQALLEMGVIEHSTSGRRGFYVRRGAHENMRTRGDLIRYFHEQSVSLVWKGMAAGISSEEMLGQLSDAISEVYGQNTVELIFIECNQQDSEEMGQTLHRALGVKVRCWLLDDLRAHPTELLERSDLIVTTFHHMAEVLELVRQNGGSAEKVAGIDTRPTPETMLGIARLPHRRIGLVSTMANTSHMLKYIIYSYHPDWVIETAVSHEKEAVLCLAEQCDHLVVTHTCVDEVRALTGRNPDVVVNFQIDDQSIIFLRQRIQEIQRIKGLALQITAENV